MLSPAERTLRARIAAHTKWASTDPREGTAAAIAAGVTKLDYWVKKVDPNLTLPETERQRRAESARQAHYARMALASSRARSARKVS